MLAFVEDVLRSAEQAIITFIRRHYIGLTVIFILALFAFGVSAFTYTIAGDEWGGLLVPDYQDGVFIQIGRWLQPPIRHFLGDATPAAAFSMLGLLCLQILSAAVIADMMKLKTRMAFFVLAAVAIFHPFWLEFVVFKYLQIPVGVGLVMATLYGNLMLRSLTSAMAGRLTMMMAHVIMACVVLVLATAVYQTFIFLGVVTFLMGLLYRVFVLQEIDFQSREVPIVLGLVAASSAIVTVSLYAGSVVLFQQVTGYTNPLLVQNENYALTGRIVRSPGDVAMALQFSGILLRQYFFQAQYAFPLAAKLIFLLFLAVLVGMGYRLNRRNNRAVRMAVFLLALVAMLLVPWLLNVVRVPTLNNYRYNALMPNAFVYAMVMAVVIEQSADRAGGVLLRALSVVMIVMFVFQHNASSTATYWLNQRDMAIANRLVYMLETNEGYAFLRERGGGEFIVIGRPTGSALLRGKPFALTPVPAPMNGAISRCGVFNCQPRRLSEMSSLITLDAVMYDYRPWEALPPVEQADLQPLVATMREFPHPDSLRIVGNRIIVVFSQTDALQ